MFGKLFPLVAMLILALSVAGSSARYDICDDINDLANEWNDVANFVNESGDEEFSEAELKALEEYVTDLSEGTFALADALIDLGNEKEVKLGAALRKAMNGVADAEGKDATVKALDALVDVIDKITDYCDEPG